jgi:putative FmdB family regulatory protein
MPVYIYQCDNCGVRFDRYQKFSEQTLNRCPECGKKTLRKVFQPVGIVFKGSGWYSTDHKSPSGGIGAPYKDGDKSNENEKHDDQTKTAESKTTESKTAENKTAESKSEGKPAPDKSAKNE